MKIKKKLSENNLYIKLLSLIVAIFLWSYVIGIVNPEINITHRGIEVQTEGTAYLQREGLSIITPQNPRVNVELNGTKSDLGNIRSANIIAVMDLEGLTPGENNVEIDVSIQGTSGRVSVVNVEPSTIVVNLDEVVSENIRLEVETLGELEESYTLGNVRPLTNYVRVTAPSQIRNQIERVVAFADVSGKTETFMVNSNLIFLDKNDIELSNIESNISTIDIEVPIYKLKSVPIEVVTVGTLSQNENIENIHPNPENVIIRGNGDIVDSINSIKTEPINVAELVENENYNVKLKLPEGVSVHENNDIKLDFDYTSSTERSINIPLADIEIRNLVDGFEYEISNSIGSMNVVIYGESSLVSSLNPEDVKPYISAAGLLIGEHEVEILIPPVEGLEFRSITPQIVQLSISNGVVPGVEGNNPQEEEIVETPDEETEVESEETTEENNNNE